MSGSGRRRTCLRPTTPRGFRSAASRNCAARAAAMNPAAGRPSALPIRPTCWTAGAMPTACGDGASEGAHTFFRNVAFGRASFARSRACVQMQGSTAKTSAAGRLQGTRSSRCRRVGDAAERRRRRAEPFVALQCCLNTGSEAAATACRARASRAVRSSRQLPCLPPAGLGNFPTTQPIFWQSVWLYLMCVPNAQVSHPFPII